MEQEHLLNRKSIISLIRFILKNPESQESRIKAELLQKTIGKGSEDFFVFEEYFTAVHIDKLLAYILPFEVYNIQSNSMKSTIGYLQDKYFNEDMSLAELFKPTLDIDNIKKKHSKLMNEFLVGKSDFKKKDIEYKHLKSMNRNAFEYNKIVDYKDFELNNNFAFECAKRKFPILYIVEFNYCSRIAERFLQHVGVSLNKECINEKEKFDAGILTAYNYQAVFEKLFNAIEDDKSFFNLFDRFYETEFTTFNEDELNEHLADLVPYFLDTFSFYDDKITRVLQTFRSPRLINSKKWEADVRLNFGLPTEQLVEYIKHLKKTLPVITSKRKNGFLTDNVMPENPVDMIHQFHKNIRSKREIRKTFGDIMFTYDCLIEKIDHKVIAEKLNEHRAEMNEQVLTEKTMSDLVTAYSELSQTLITNEHFITFIDPRINVSE